MAEAMTHGAPPAGESVCAVIVTYNRRELLAESITAVLAQSRPPDSVIVVDNASEDGSREMLEERFADVEVLRLERNEGAAGGFHEGIKEAHARGHDQIWLMDDDTIPEPQALAELLAARAEPVASNAAFVASKVVWSDGRTHPMNRPWLTWKDTDMLIENVAAGHGLLPVRATTWVSMLLERETVERHGLPEKRYFMWSEDIEYTARVTRHDSAFLAVRSIAVHKTPEPHTALTSAGERYYFHVRNQLYMLRSSGWSGLEKASLILNLFRSVRAFLQRERFRPHALGVVARGIRDGIVAPRDPAGPYL